MKRFIFGFLFLWFAISAFSQSQPRKARYKALEIYQNGTLLLRLGECEVSPETYGNNKLSSENVHVYRINYGDGIMEITRNDSVVFIGERFTTPKRVQK